MSSARTGAAWSFDRLDRPGEPPSTGRSSPVPNSASTMTSVRRGTRCNGWCSPPPRGSGADSSRRRPGGGRGVPQLQDADRSPAALASRATTNPSPPLLPRPATTVTSRARPQLAQPRQRRRAGPFHQLVAGDAEVLDRDAVELADLGRTVQRIGQMVAAWQAACMVPPAGPCAHGAEGHARKRNRLPGRRAAALGVSPCGVARRQTGRHRPAARLSSRHDHTHVGRPCSPDPSRTGGGGWDSRRWASPTPTWRRPRSLLDWLSAGCHGEMAYMARHGTRRSRPEALVPGTLRVICARMDYFPPGDDPHLRPGRSRIGLHLALRARPRLPQAAAHPPSAARRPHRRGRRPVRLPRVRRFGARAGEGARRQGRAWLDREAHQPDRPRGRFLVLPRRDLHRPAAAGRRAGRRPLRDLRAPASRPAPRGRSSRPTGWTRGSASPT